MCKILLLLINHFIILKLWRGVGKIEYWLRLILSIKSRNWTDLGIELIVKIQVQVVDLFAEIINIVVIIGWFIRAGFVAWSLVVAIIIDIVFTFSSLQHLVQKLHGGVFICEELEWITFFCVVYYEIMLEVMLDVDEGI